MIRFLLPIFLLLAAFPLAAQGCYENLQNGAGVSADPSRASSAACKLRESLPEANRASFATYSASLYRFAGNFAPGAAEALVTRLEARAAAASPYYLLIVWEASEDNLFATPHVRVNLPADGPFTCLNPLRRSAWQARLLLQAQGDAPKAKDPEDYLRAETKLMEELSGYVKDLIKCCQEGQTCPDCITRKERIALLKAYPFRTIGQTNYDPAALKYRVDNVEIPGNSTAQIRDGIGIPLDLGGGPIDIAETLKQLALEKPELGLNALIVHDSLLCDPELAPGRFFGGPGLRAAGSQVYVVLVNVEDKATGNMLAQLRVIGDEQGVKEAYEKITQGMEFGEIPTEVPSEDKIDPCNYESKESNTLYYAPSGKLIKITGLIVPEYSKGDDNFFPIGCLKAFTIDKIYYVGVRYSKSKKFIGYVKLDYIKKILDPTNNTAPGSYIGTPEWVENTFKEFDANVSSGQMNLTWTLNNVAFHYEWLASDMGTLNSEATSGDHLLPQQTSPTNDCKPCKEGPGAEFFASYEDLYRNDANLRLSLCRIAAMFNLLGKEVVEALTRGDWSAKEMEGVYGNHVTLPDFSPDTYLHGLQEFVDWYVQAKETWSAFVEASKRTKLAMSMVNLGPAYVKLLSLDDRKAILSLLLDKNLSTLLLWDKTYRKKAVISLITNVKKEEMKPLMDFLIDPERMEFLFSSTGFGNVYGDDTFKEFVSGMINLWRQWIDEKSDDEKIKLLYDGLVVLGKVKYANLTCQIEVDGNEHFNGENINVNIVAPYLTFATQNMNQVPACGKKKPQLVNCSATGIIEVYFFTEHGGIGTPKTRVYMPAFLLPYLVKLESNNYTKGVIQAGLTALELAGLASGIGALSVASRLTKFQKVIAILDVASTSSEYLAIAADPVIKNAFGNNTAAYKEFMAGWNHVNTVLGIGNIIVNGVDAVKNITDIVKTWRAASKANPGTANVNEAVKKFAAILGEIEMRDELIRRLQQLAGVNSDDAAKYADELILALNKQTGGLQYENISDNFIKLYAQIDDPGPGILRNMFEDKEKFLALQEDLKDANFFDAIKDDINVLNQWSELNAYLSKIVGINNEIRKRAIKALTEYPSEYVESLKIFGIEPAELFYKHAKDYGDEYYAIIDNFLSNNPGGLNKDEVYAIFGYTTNFFYKDFNDWLRRLVNQDRVDDIKNLIIRALSKLPDWNGGRQAYRGIKIKPPNQKEQIEQILNRYNKGEIINHPEFISLSSSPEASFLGDNRVSIEVIFTLKDGSEAKDISALADGIFYRGMQPYELLLPPNISLFVKDKWYDPPSGKWIIELVEQ